MRVRVLAAAEKCSGVAAWSRVHEFCRGMVRPTEGRYKNVVFVDGLVLLTVKTGFLAGWRKPETNYVIQAKQILFHAGEENRGLLLETWRMLIRHLIWQTAFSIPRISRWCRGFIYGPSIPSPLATRGFNSWKRNWVMRHSLHDNRNHLVPRIGLILQSYASIISEFKHFFLLKEASLRKFKL